MLKCINNIASFLRRCAVRHMSGAIAGSWSGSASAWSPSAAARTSWTAPSGCSASTWWPWRCSGPSSRRVRSQSKHRQGWWHYGSCPHTQTCSGWIVQYWPLMSSAFCVIKCSEIQIRSRHFLLLSWEITQPNLNLGNSIVSWIHSINLLRNFYKLAFSKLSQPAIWMCLHQGLVGYWVLAVSEP